MEEIVFDIAPEDEAISPDALEAEIQAGLDERAALVAKEFPNLAGIPQDQLPDGVGDELRGALTHYQDQLLRHHPVPTMEQDAAFVAARFAMECQVLGDYEDLMDIAMGNKSFFE